VGLAYKQKEKKRNGKEEMEGVLRASVCWAGLGLLPRVGPVGCYLFFVLFFSIFCPLFNLGFGL
jgi:hypothetical protein